MKNQWCLKITVVIWVKGKQEMNKPSKKGQRKE